MAAAAITVPVTRRPWLCFVLLSLTIVIVVAGSGPLLALLGPLRGPRHAQATEARSGDRGSSGAQTGLAREAYAQTRTLTPPPPPSRLQTQTQTQTQQQTPQAQAQAQALAQTLPQPHSQTQPQSQTQMRPQPQTQTQQQTQARTQTQTQSQPRSGAAPRCGDGRCDPAESVGSCFGDCPGVSTPPQCGEEPHSDPQGHAVVDGRGHKTKDPAECCAACAAHAANPRNAKRPCNSWVFCYMPQCWSLDTGNKHTLGECWLKWQANPNHPLYGQRGRYSDAFQQRHRDAHRHNNLSVPTHVPWAGGVMGARYDPSVSWETHVDGTMRSSAGEIVIDYRPWESREQNLKRGVKPEQMQF